MPYGLIALIASIVLACRYLALPNATTRSKQIVGGIVAGSLLIAWFLPQLSLVANLLQIGIAIYVAIYLQATSESR